LHVWKSKTFSGPAARAVSGANTRSTAVRPNTTFDNVLPLTADVCISSSKANALLNFGFPSETGQHSLSVLEMIAQHTGPTSGLQRHLVSRATLRIFRAEAANQWRDAVTAA
jgi:hypothetical protein